ncbi:hypothetical protein EYS14_03845 [Alteromonadaceae bacterium M269]|nr:hypothetical protein EYS14_03845 [Alteromonadaceae bacterium M269]
MIKLKSLLEQVVAGVIVLAIGGVAGWVANTWMNPKLPVVTAVIENPINDTELNYKPLIKGRYSGHLKESKIWVMVSHIETPERYFPYRISLEAPNAWRSLIYLGDTDDSDLNEHFVISVVQISASGSKSVEDYIATTSNQATKDPSYIYPGIQGLPTGSRKLDVINVVRK